jgi:hypothetical protein
VKPVKIEVQRKNQCRDDIFLPRLITFCGNPASKMESPADPLAAVARKGKIYATKNTQVGITFNFLLCTSYF